MEWMAGKSFGYEKMSVKKKKGKKKKGYLCPDSLYGSRVPISSEDDFLAFRYHSFYSK